MNTQEQTALENQKLQSQKEERSLVLMSSKLLKNLWKRSLGHPAPPSGHSGELVYWIECLFDIVCPLMWAMNLILRTGSCPLPAGTYFIVSMEYLKKWREYLDDVEADNPGTVDNSLLTCPHGRLMFMHMLASLCIED